MKKLSARARNGINCAMQINFPDEKCSDDGYTPEQVSMMARSEAMRAPNLGRVTLAEIEDWLADSGLGFKAQMTESEVVFETYKKVAAELLKNPDDPEQLSNQFTLLTARGPRNPSHLMMARRCYEIAPKNFTALFNLGSAYHRAGDYKEALNCFTRAQEFCPPDKRHEVLAHIGLAWETLGEFTTALRSYDQAIDLNPNDPEIRQSRALALIQSGKMGEGLFEFECLYYKPARKPISESGIPRWMGEPLDGKHIIIHHEQGYGDTIQFCRVIPEVRKRAQKVTLAFPPDLTALLKTSFEADEWVDEKGPFKADYYCSPISAFGAMKTELAQVTGEPYLWAKPIKLPPRGKHKIGLVWRGSAGYSADVERSTDLATLAPILEIPGLAFYSLQVGEATREISKMGLDGFIVDLSPAIKNWADTARAVMAMDAVIGVDTGVNHLSGALGKTTYTLLPWACDWRWSRGSRNTNFYNSVTTYRQQVAGDWSHPVNDIVKNLRGWF